MVPPESRMSELQKYTTFYIYQLLMKIYPLDSKFYSLSNNCMKKIGKEPTKHAFKKMCRKTLQYSCLKNTETTATKLKNVNVFLNFLEKKSDLSESCFLYPSNHFQIQVDRTGKP